MTRPTLAMPSGPGRRIAAMRTLLIAALATLVLAAPAAAKTCERECKTHRVVPGHAAVQWNSEQSFHDDDLVKVSVWINGKRAEGTFAATNNATYTRGKRTVSIITRERSAHMEVRASNFAQSSARITVKFQQQAVHRVGSEER